MKDYCERAKKLLEASRSNSNAFDSLKPTVPTGVNLEPNTQSFDEMEELGLQELSKVGLVLIAGGLGERLGFSGIKIGLPVCTIAENYTYMKYYAQYALAIKDRAVKLGNLDPATFFVPFCIMVSDDTHDRTV